MKTQEPRQSRRKLETMVYFLRWDGLARPRKIRQDLTPWELERLAKYGSLEYRSAGATRKR